MTGHHRARRLPVHDGPAAWASILGPGPAFPRLTEDRSADVVVVGAGFAGLSAARRLRQVDPALSVVVLEAGDIAEGAAGRNSGFMIDLPHELTSEDYAGQGDDRATIALNRQAIAFARAAVADYGIPTDYFDPAGKVNGAASEEAHARNVSFASHLSELGEPHEVLDAKQMRDLTGSQHYISGLYAPGTVMLQPAGYIRGLARGLADAGGAIHVHSPVTSLSRDGTGWRVETPKAVVSAGQVILATNGHLESFGFAASRLMHLFLYASMTEPLDDAAKAKLGGTPRWGITPSDPMGTTIRRIDTGQGGDRIVVRTCATLRSGMETRPGDLARAEKVHRQKFEQRFQMLAGVRMSHSWAGHLCLGRGDTSVVGQLDDGLFAACVQNGLGTTRGTLTGLAAAEMALGQESDITRHFAGRPMPPRLPPRLVRDPVANAYLRWKEWRAAAE